MIRIIRAVMIAVVLFAFPLVPSAATAQHGEVDAHAQPTDAGHGSDSADAEHTPGLLDEDPGLAIWTIILFVVLLAVLGKFAWPPILRGLQDREQKIRGDLENAEKAAKDATETLKEYHAKLAAANEDSRKLLAEARADAERTAGELKDKAHDDIDQMRQRAQQDITAAKEQAINDIYAQTASLATQVAGRILQREIRPEDQQQLIDESLQQFRSAQDN